MREHTSIEDDWKAIKETISNVAERVLGKTMRQEKKPWYDDDAEQQWKEEMKQKSKQLIIV
jgi:hypothetical protein